MPKGTMKWFNPTKGYRFIQPHGGGKDVFVHISAVEQAGLATLNDGQVVEYEETSDKGRTSAGRLKISPLSSTLFSLGAGGQVLEKGPNVSEPHRVELAENNTT